MSSLRKAVFLDRDGVINQTLFRNGKKRAPDRLEDFTFFPDVPDAILRLREAGYLLIVVTNQPDVVRGWQTREVVESMNQRVIQELAVDEVLVCYHVDEDQCLCRKPQPGMLHDAARRWGIDLARSFMVGDRYSDVTAGIEAGCRTLLIGEDSEHWTASSPPPVPDFCAQNLGDAVNWILTLKI